MLKEEIENVIGGDVQNCRTHLGARRKTRLKMELTLKKAEEGNGKNLHL